MVSLRPRQTIIQLLPIETSFPNAPPVVGPCDEIHCFPQRFYYCIFAINRFLLLKQRVYSGLVFRFLTFFFSVKLVSRRRSVQRVIYFMNHTTRGQRNYSSAHFKTVEVVTHLMTILVCYNDQLQNFTPLIAKKYYVLSKIHQVINVKENRKPQSDLFVTYVNNRH